MRVLQGPRAGTRREKRILVFRSVVERTRKALARDGDQVHRLRISTEDQGLRHAVEVGGAAIVERARRRRGRAARIRAC